MKLRWNKTVALAAVGAMALTAVPLLAGTATSAASKPTYTIGVQGPFTGSDADYGLYEYAGVEYAVSLANASGKYDFTLKAEKFDDQGSSTVAPGAAQKAVGTKGLVAIVGPSFSGASQVSYQYYHAAHIAEVSPSATAVALASGSDSSFFRTVADDSVQGSADASYLVTTKGEKNLTVIGDESFYGQGLANVVVATQAAKLGATVTRSQSPISMRAAAVTLVRTAPWRPSWPRPTPRRSSTEGTHRSSVCSSVTSRATATRRRTT